MFRGSLDSWLQYIATVHPREIELGLDRSRTVARRLNIIKPAPLVVTVAGTNGKGSCIATLEAILQASGIRTAAYTSPHIHRFNERIRIDEICVDDQSIIQAFEEIDAVRQDESLSYFEFATLAALLLFKKAAVDIALLEVGLGGRLDAVNIVDADVTVITSIGIDHREWLGDDIETIAAEKAGIMRPRTALVFGGTELPRAIDEQAESFKSPLFVQGREFGYSEEPSASTWNWRGLDASGQQVVLSDLPMPGLALANVAAALQAVQLLPLSLNSLLFEQVLSRLQLAGRFERRRDISSGRTVIFDVAHNPDAMQLLASNIGRFRAQGTGFRRLIAVLALMADKDVVGMLTALESCVDIWYIAQVDQARGMAVDKVAQTMKIVGNTVEQPRYLQFDSVESAYMAACSQADQQDMILVTGSFFTVAAVHGHSEQA